jgi:phosphatidylglycerol:prolipoprotein diacylglycerol transferase
VLDAIFYHPSTVARNPLYLLKIWDGLSSYGGFVGAVVGSLAWGYYRRQKVLGYIDITVSAMPLAWVFGRAGCSVVHDHPGVLSDFWLAVRFPPHELMKSVEWGPPFVGRFDLGFLEFLLTIPLAVAVAVLWRRKLDRPNGYYISVVCLAYAPVRFVLDFLRLGADAPVLGGDPRYGGLTPAQWASAALFATAAVVLVRMYRTPPSSEPALAAAGPVADEPPADEPPADEPPADEPAASTPPAGAPSAPSSDSAHEPASSGPAEAGPGAGAPAAERVERDDPPSTR